MVLLAKIALGLTGTVLLGAGVLCSEGFLDVKVDENRPGGAHIHVVAPALLVPIALRLVPEHNLVDAGEHLRPWLPTVQAAAQALRDAGDLDLVVVHDHEDHVRVAKSGGSILVDVNDPREAVHVSAPLAMIQSAVAALPAAPPAESPAP